MSEEAVPRDDFEPDHAYGYAREDEWPVHTDWNARNILNGGAFVAGASPNPNHVFVDIPSYGLKEVHMSKIYGLNGTIPFTGQAIKLPFGSGDRFVIATTEFFEVAEAGFRGIHEAPESA